MFESIKNYFKTAWQFGKALSPDLRSLGRSGQALGTIISLVVAGIGLMIGVYVFSETESAMDITENSRLDNIVGDIYGAYSMTPIILIVLIAGAIIGVLTMFRAE